MMLESYFQFLEPASDVIKHIASSYFFVKSDDPAFLQEQPLLPYPQHTFGFFFDCRFEVQHNSGERIVVDKYSFAPLRVDSATLIPMSKQVEIFGVNLHPYAIRCFTDRNADSLSWNVSADDIFGSDVRVLYDQLRNTDNIHSRCALLEQFLLEHIRREPDQLMVEAIRLIHQKPVIRISELASEIDIGERTFRNKFREEIGISPKAYQKMVSLHAAVASLSNSNQKVVEVSNDHLFFDQSHFNKSFREIINSSPARFKKKMHRFRFLQF